MIYFVRHGETDFNVQEIVQGNIDVPLNENGISQAKTIRDKLKQIKFDVIYSSPLLRAKQTAQIIADVHGTKVLFDDRLREYHAGIREGLKYSDWNEEQRKDFKLNPEKYGAEKLVDFYKRVSDFYKEVSITNKKILIVSHFGVYKQIYYFLNNISNFFEPVKMIQNCEVVILKE